MPTCIPRVDASAFSSKIQNDKYTPVFSEPQAVMLFSQATA
jgi:hypothetical protein